MEATYDMVAAYTQLGFLGTFFVVTMGIVIWYFTKGRRKHTKEREKMIMEQVRIGEIINNNTAVINNNTKVIEANMDMRKTETAYLGQICDRMQRHGEQLDAIERQQAICLDRQQRKQ